MPDKKPTANITLENIQIARPNFSGLEGVFNAKGKRNFLAVLPEDIAQAMQEDGWNVKRFKPKEEGVEPEPFIQVQVKFGKRPPRIVLVSSRGKTQLDEEMVSILDWVNIIKCDLIIRPYNWSNPAGNEGVAAYAQAVYVTIELDKLEEKYYDVPDSAASSLPITGAPDEEDDD